MKGRSGGRGAITAVIGSLLAALLIPLVLALLAALALALGDRVGGPVSSGSPLHFDHALHVVDAEMTCDACHEGVAELEERGRAIPDHENCEACHDLEKESSCGLCHVDPENPQAVPLRPGLYEGFAHADHVGDEAGCASCHGHWTADADVAGAAAQGAAERTFEPRIPVMIDCQQCHLSQGGPIDCGACHLGLSPLPLDHGQGDWRRDHGLEATAATSDCASCHAQASCDACHQGVLLDGSPHDAAWLHEHWAEASFGQDCLVCHETRRACTECHRALVPVPHVFGPGFANDRDGGTHADEAEAFPETCLSCHDVESADPVCARCHGE